MNTEDILELIDKRGYRTIKGELSINSEDITKIILDLLKRIQILEEKCQIDGIKN